MLEVRAGLRRILAVAVVAVVLPAAFGAASAGASTATSAGHSRACLYVGKPIVSIPAASVNAAGQCAIGDARKRAGRSVQRASAPLNKSALAHAKKSVAGKFWSLTDGLVSHTEPGSTGTASEQIQQRIVAAGYCPGGTAVTNENTFSAEGTGTLKPTPAGAVKWWLSDPPHKATLLSTKYVNLGVGAVDGSPFPPPNYTPASTFVIDYGTCK